jgi:hypothetical protein
MSTGTAIEWTEVTWNPTTGCDRISPGCDNCYALRLAGRLKAMGSAKYQTDGDPRTSGPGFGVAQHPHVLTDPQHWRDPRLVFVNSMSDLSSGVESGSNLVATQFLLFMAVVLSALPCATGVAHVQGTRDSVAMRGAGRGKSKSPSRTSSTNDSQASGVKTSTGPFGFVESRTKFPLDASATSTHAAESQRRLFRHSVTRPLEGSGGPQVACLRSVLLDQFPDEPECRYDCAPPGCEDTPPLPFVLSVSSTTPWFHSSFLLGLVLLGGASTLPTSARLQKWPIVVVAVSGARA